MFHVHLAEAQIPPAGKLFSGQPPVIRGLQSTAQHNISRALSPSFLLSASLVFHSAPSLTSNISLSLYESTRLSLASRESLAVFRCHWLFPLNQPLMGGCVFCPGAEWQRVLGHQSFFFLQMNRAHLFHRRSQREAALLISFGQTLACVKCLQNQQWRWPRALVDIYVCVFLG